MSNLATYSKSAILSYMKLPIYLDYAATTPVDPRVANKMFQYLTLEGQFGNPSSLSHVFGLDARAAVEGAREQVASLLGADSSEMIWTSGATEANNLALKGAAALYQRKGKHIVTLKTEHKSILDCCEELEKKGYQITYLTPETDGLLDLEKLKAAIRDDTFLVSIMHVNNETGVIQDIQSIAQITAERGILFHVDAAQSAGKIPLNLKATPIDLLSACAHKIYGPKGIGILYVRRKPRVRVAAQIHGGGQESGMRSGTLPTHQIVGMGEAFEIAGYQMQDDYVQMFNYRKSLIQAFSKLSGFTVNGHSEKCYPGILNASFDGITAEKFMVTFPELALAAGSACHSKGIEASYVLRAMGLTEAEARCGIRFSLGRMTSEHDIHYVIDLISKKMRY